MKKMIFLFLSLTLVAGNIKADDDKPIEFAQLPVISQQFIKKYFPGKTIALVKMESDFFDKSYEVIFTNGDKAEFNKKGEWKDIDCKYTEVPAALVPEAIRKYATQHYPDTKIIKIEKEKRQGYEIELSNRIELTFNSKFQLIDIDH